MSNHKKIGLVGIFEDYNGKATGPSFQTIPGIEYGKVKNFVHQYPWLNNLWFVHDSVYVLPAATCFGTKQLDTALCHLYTSLSNTLNILNGGHNALVFQSVVDIYAEIMLYHRRQKWLEPLIQREIASYDKLILIPNDQYNEQYHMMVRRIMHDFKGNYVKADTLEQIVEEIRQCL